VIYTILGYNFHMTAARMTTFFSFMVSCVRTDIAIDSYQKT